MSAWGKLFSQQGTGDGLKGKNIYIEKNLWSLLEMLPLNSSSDKVFKFNINM